MVGLMTAGIALTVQGVRNVAGIILITVAVAVKATAESRCPLVWVWLRHLRERRGYRRSRAFLAAAAISLLIFVAFACCLR